MLSLRILGRWPRASAIRLDLRALVRRTSRRPPCPRAYCTRCTRWRDDCWDHSAPPSSNIPRKRCDHNGNNSSKDKWKCEFWFEFDVISMEIITFSFLEFKPRLQLLHSPTSSKCCQRTSVVAWRISSSCTCKDCDSLTKSRCTTSLLSSSVWRLLNLFRNWIKSLSAFFWKLFFSNERQLAFVVINGEK